MLFVKSKLAIFLLEALGSPFCRHRLGGSKRIQNKHRQNTNWCEQNKDSWQHMEVTPVLLIAGKVCINISHDILKFSRYFEIFMYSF
jgi:uncharacterized protein YbaR (Trm112 family)